MPGKDSGQAKSEKRKLLWALLIAQGASQLVYMNISTLVPDYVLDNYPTINSFDVGIMFAAYQLCFVIIAPVLGDCLPKFGRKKSIRFGSVLMTIATLMFASGALFENPLAFYLISFFARAL